MRKHMTLEQQITLAEASKARSALEDEITNAMRKYEAAYGVKVRELETIEIVPLVGEKDRKDLRSVWAHVEL